MSTTFQNISLHFFVEVSKHNVYFHWLLKIYNVLINNYMGELWVLLAIQKHV
jgi:hypothetical protein